MKKKLLSLVLSLALVLTFATPAFADSELNIANKNNIAYDLSLVRLNAAYDYLNEMYLDTNLGMYVEYATQKDIETLSKLADDITYGCYTDEEKCLAIYDWMDFNVAASFGSYAPIDVFRTLSGVCSGHAQLMSALMKLSGVKAAVVRGYLVDTENTILKDIYADKVEGHQWVMAYYNNDWYVFDDLWDECGNNDREDIASRYYTVNVDGVSAYAEEIDTTKGEFKCTQTVYKDGEFIGMEYGHITDYSSAKLSVGGCLNYSKTYYNSTFDNYSSSLSGAINTTYGYAIAGGYYDYLGSNIHYVKENGISLSSTVVNYNDSLIFMNDVDGIIIDEDIDNNGLTNGNLNMYVGESIDLSDLYGDDTVIISTNKNVVTVEGKVITAIASGYADVRIGTGQSKGSLPINVYGDAITSVDSFKYYCDHEETHIGCDGCEYCDYCGMFIETVEEQPTEIIKEAEIETVATSTDLQEIIEEITTTSAIASNTDLSINSEPEFSSIELDAPQAVEELAESPFEELVEIAEEVIEETVVEESVVPEPVQTFASAPYVEEEPAVDEVFESLVEEDEEVETEIVEQIPTQVYYETSVVNEVTKDNLSINFSFNNTNYQFGTTNSKYNLTLDIINYVDGLDMNDVFSLEEIQNFLIDILNESLEDNVFSYSFIIFIIPM